MNEIIEMWVMFMDGNRASYEFSDYDSANYAIEAIAKVQSSPLAVFVYGKDKEKHGIVNRDHVLQAGCNIANSDQVSYYASWSRSRRAP